MPSDNARPLTIAQLLVSLFGLTLLVLGFIGLAILLLIGPVSAEFSDEQSNQLRLLLWVIFLLILLTIPSLVSSIRRLAGKPPRITTGVLFLISTLSLVLVPLFIFLGGRLSTSENGAWLFGPINVLIVFIPLWWFLELGRLRLTQVSAQCQWGVASFSFFITLPLVIVVELIVMGIGLLLGAAWLVQQPEFAPVFQQLEQALSTGAFDPQNLGVDWLSLLQRPGIIISIVMAAALIVPLIEELLKPLGVWALIKRGLTPTGGFIAGMLSGAAFALIESLFSLSAVSGDEWVYTVLGRVGTGLLHLTLTGFNGWALASSWKDGHAIRTGTIFILTVLVHGTWNLFALLMGLNMVGNEPQMDVNPALTASAPWVLAALAVGMLVALVIMNLHLRRASRVSPSVPSPLPPFTREGLE